MKIPHACWRASAHALIAMAIVLSSGCDRTGDTPHGTNNGTAQATAGDGIWNGGSVAIDFELTGAVGQEICKFSAMRDELTPEQLEGLSGLKLHDAAVRAGCDVASYKITVHAKDGSPERYWATLPDCSGEPIVLFDDFDAWASSTPCSFHAKDATTSNERDGG
jgi:hypothetical protein